MYWLGNAGFVWVPLIIAATIAAWFGMNDIASAKASFADQAVIFKRKHNWLMCFLLHRYVRFFYRLLCRFCDADQSAVPRN
jgi:nitrate/nitrite transporter NarK